MAIFGAPLRDVGQEAGIQARIAEALRQQQPAQFQPRKRTLSDNLGLLADAFRGTHDNEALLLDQEQQERAAWSAQQQNQQARNEWLFRQQWERANPKPSTAAPHYWETNNGSLGVIGPDGKPQIVYEDPTPKMNYIPDGLGGGQWVAVPTSTPSVTAPTAPVGALKPVGKLTPITGGASHSGSRGFR